MPTPACRRVAYTVRVRGCEMDRQADISWLGRAVVVLLGALVLGGGGWLAAWLLLGAALCHCVMTVSAVMAELEVDPEMGENRYRREPWDRVS